MTRMSHVPRASFPLFGILLVILLSGPRLAYRWFKDRERYRPEAVFHAFEELSHPIEPLGQTRHEKILLARHRRLIEHDGFAARLAELRRACDAFDEPALERIVAELAPEYLHGPSPSAEDVVPIGLAKR